MSQQTPERAETADPPRGDGGLFSEQTSDLAFTNALIDLGGSASTAEVADHVGLPGPSTYRRLDALAGTWKIDRRKVGASILWSLGDANNR